jgi:hypothetical protein
MELDLVEVATIGEFGYKRPVHRLSWKQKKSFFSSIGYKPHRYQELFHKSLARMRVVCAGARGGKSCSSGNEVAADLLLPDRQWWIVGKHYGLAEKEFRYVKDALVNHPDPSFRSFIRASITQMADNKQNGQMYMRFKWGSWIECRSIQDPDSLLGEELDGIILSEGSKIPLHVWRRFLKQRLASRMGQLIVPTTPSGYDDFLHPLFLQGQDKSNHIKGSGRGIRKGDEYPGSVESWVFPSVANPAYPKEEYEEALRQVQQGTMDQATFDEQYGGKFVSMTGRIYKAFNPDVHIVSPYVVPKSWGTVRGVDVGMDAPTVCLLVRIDPEGTIVVTDEYYQEGVSVIEHAKSIKEMSVDHNGVPLDVWMTVIDPAASQRTANNPESTLQQYVEQGIVCLKANNAVEAGISRVTEYLDYETDDNGKVIKFPKIRIFNRCSNLIREFDQYVYADTRDGLKTNKPAKRNDHGLDVLRYIVMSQPRVPSIQEEIVPGRDTFAHMMNETMRSAYAWPKLGG